MLGLSPDNSDYLEKDNPVVAGEWNHFAFSFNQRAFKGYVNGVRMINVPAMKAPGYLFFASGSFYRYTGLSNVRIAQGAVPLYDRLTNDGKIVSYAITFVKQGIAQSRLTPVGKGSHSPIAPKDTAEGRAKNRRVEFVKK